MNLEYKHNNIKYRKLLYIFFVALALIIMIYDFLSYKVLSKFDDKYTQSLIETILTQKILISLVVFLVMFYLFNSVAKKMSDIINDLIISSKRYELAINGSQDGLWDWDLQTNHIYYSARWNQMLGLDEREKIDTLGFWTGRIHPLDLNVVLCNIKDHTKGITPKFESIHRILHHNGNYIWVLARGKLIYDNNKTPLRLVGFHTDITHLRELETNYQEVLDLFNSSELVMFKCKNDANWSVEYVSPNVHRVLGFHKEDFLARTINFRDLIHPDDLFRVDNEVAENSNIDEYLHSPYRIKHQDGHYIYIRDMTKLIRNDSGEIISLSGFIMDITKDVEKEKITLQEAKLSSISELLSNIAHQWRQPLSIICSATSGLKLQYEYNQLDATKFTKTMDEIVEYTQYLSSTLESFNKYLTREANKGYFLVTNTIDIANTIVSSSLNQNNIQVHIQCENTTKLFGFQNDLVQVFLTLFENSIDAFATKNSITNKWIDIRVTQENSLVKIVVQDNGGGIEKNVLAHIFEPYVTTKHKKIGVGLGLFSAHKIITDNFHGTITGSNEEDKATFIIVIDNANLQK